MNDAEQARMAALREATDAARAVSDGAVVDQGLVSFALAWVHERDAWLARPRKRRGRE